MGVRGSGGGGGSGGAVSASAIFHPRVVLKRETMYASNRRTAAVAGMHVYKDSRQLQRSTMGRSVDCLQYSHLFTTMVKLSVVRSPVYHDG